MSTNKILPLSITPCVSETDHCRVRLMRYCRGQGLDLGCGRNKIRPDAIGIDLYSPFADMNSEAQILHQYKDQFFDYVYSSHLLEEIQDTEETLREWLRVIRPGGYLVLYQADKNLYYPIGSPQCNSRHIRHFVWEDLWKILEKIGNNTLIHHASYPEKKEWSFELVVRKNGGKLPTIKNYGISILVPTKNRPDDIQKLAESINSTAKYPEWVELIIGHHADDLRTINKIQELKLQIKIKDLTIEKYKDGKAHLSFFWNQCYRHASYDIIGYFGDDIIFHTPGWDEEVYWEFEADKTIMVSCNDVHIQKGKNTTLFFTHKCIHEAAGFYMNEKYRRWYTDTFWDRVFKINKKVHYREDLVMEHLHPDKFPERMDETFSSMEDLIDPDKKIWFSIENKNEIYRIANILANQS